MVATVTLACVLLVGAGLFMRSFAALLATDVGFRPAKVLTASMTLPRTVYSTAASVRAFYDSLDFFSSLLSLDRIPSSALWMRFRTLRIEVENLMIRGFGFDGQQDRRAT